LVGGGSSLSASLDDFYRLAAAALATETVNMNQFKFGVYAMQA